MKDNTITIKITAKDAKKCKRFLDIRNCLFSTAIKRQLGLKNITTGATEIIQYNDVLFTNSMEDVEKVRDCYDEKGQTIKQPFTPFTVTLERIEHIIQGNIPEIEQKFLILKELKQK